MELEQLRHFVEIVEHGSFTRAAASLGVNQPLLSRQIRRLEIEFGAVLLYRTGRGVQPTTVGVRLATTVKSILDQLAAVADGASETDIDLRGRVVIGLPPSLGRVLTVPIIRAFSTRFPNAKAVIVEGLSRTLREHLLNGKIDVAILHDQSPLPSLDVDEIAMEPLCLISPRIDGADVPSSIAFEDIVSLPLIFPCAPNSIRAIVEDAASRRGVKLDIKYEVDGVDAILQLVLEGFGSAIAGATILEKTRYADILPVQRIVQPVLRTRISLARSARRQTGVLHERAASLMTDIARQELLADEPGADR